jgi:hypothetical protein
MLKQKSLLRSDLLRKLTSQGCHIYRAIYHIFPCLQFYSSLIPSNHSPLVLSAKIITLWSILVALADEIYPRTELPGSCVFACCRPGSEWGGDLVINTPKMHICDPECIPTQWAFDGSPLPACFFDGDITLKRARK